jgi:hypothetical protein
MQPFSTRNIEQLITYPFKDPRWQGKLLFAFLAVIAGFFIPVLPWLVSLGYMAQVIRLAASTPGLPDALPEWDDFGQIVKDGLRLLGVMAIYFLPAIVFFFAAYAAMIAGTFAASFGRYGMYSSYRVFPPLLPMLGFFFLFGLSMLFSVLVSFFAPAVIAHTAVKQRFSAAFDFKEWWQIFRANWKAFLIALVLTLGITYALTFAYQVLVFTIVLICLMPFMLAAISTYLIPISGALFGAAYREALQNLHPAAVSVPEPPAAPEPPAPSEPEI